MLYIIADEKDGGVAVLTVILAIQDVIIRYISISLKANCNKDAG